MEKSQQFLKGSTPKFWQVSLKPEFHELEFEKPLHSETRPVLLGRQY